MIGDVSEKHLQELEEILPEIANLVSIFRGYQLWVIFHQEPTRTKFGGWWVDTLFTKRGETPAGTCVKAESLL